MPLANRGPLVSPVWTLALPALSLAAMVASPPERRLWVAPCAALVFSIMQWLLPRCRLRRDHYLGPVNIALFLLLIQLFILPSLIMLTGPESPMLANLPSYSSITNAILLQMAAYVALCVGLAHGPRAGERAAMAPAALAGPGPGPALVLLYFLLGLAGFVAVFGTPGRMIEYLLSAEEISTEPDSSLAGAAGTFLRPFLAFALVAAWSRWAARASLTVRCLTLFALALCVTIANMTYSFNRAAFVFPLISLLAVFSATVRRIPFAATALVMLAAFPLLIGVGMFRSSRMIGGQPVATDFTTWLEQTSTSVQAYAGGPQFTALFCERLGWGESLYDGSTLIASVMSPVPILGKGFREGNGPALYNQAIYDVRYIQDQILPFSVELFANFHLPGTIIGFLLLGFAVATLQEWFATAESPFAAFCIQYAGLWTAMLGAWSLSIYAQIAIYFFGPIYLFAAVTTLPVWRRVWVNTWLRRAAA